GTTPKMLAREPEARLVGYGGMVAESFVAIMATIAACSMQPGTYFAISSPAGVVGAAPELATTTITSMGYPVTATAMHALEQQVGEKTLFNRTGGAPAFAVGMTEIFSRVFPQNTRGTSAVMSMWYHFAIMFEALFILSVLDAGTRVARFMLQDGLAHLHPWCRRSSAQYTNIVLTSVLVVAAWGYLLVQAVRDPLGGINSMWPIFGIVNQLLAAVALSVATSILARQRKWRYIPVTLVPMAWLVTVTFTAALEKVFHPAPKIGFLAHARSLQSTPGATRLIQADYLNAGMTLFFIALVAILMIESLTLWIRIALGHKTAETFEADFITTRLAEGEI
ncbi:MAG: carbon starvation protein A, partial [Acidobacteriales bacterium]|nr:carbon starvation protein A [Terriglobales bacterium]